ncbi:TPA: HAD hydrolase family protein [Vibrio cholerae]|nr:HAD hydrolase family protein [Vibrio cholerae]
MIYCFSDLDDSLFQSAKKCNVNIESCKLASFKTNGERHGFSTPAQQQFIDLIKQNGTLIPVTARSENVFSRVCMEFDSYKATTHGAIVLAPNGAIDPEWKTYLDENCSIYNEKFQALVDLARTLVEESNIEPTIIGVKEDYGYPCYFNIKVASKDSSKLEKLLYHFHSYVNSNREFDDFAIHWNDRTFDILPPYTSKAKAVEFIYKKLGITSNDLVFGLGDSISDLPFMNQCDFLMIPKKSQIVTRRKLG